MIQQRAEPRSKANSIVLATKTKRAATTKAPVRPAWSSELDNQSEISEDEKDEEEFEVEYEADDRSTEVSDESEPAENEELGCPSDEESDVQTDAGIEEMRTIRVKMSRYACNNVQNF